MKKLMGLLVAIAMICTFAGSAAAANEWAMYGSARMATFWTDLDLADDEDLRWNLDNSRFGAKVKAGDVKGQLEVGFPQLGADTFGRIMWGEWDFGPGDLGVGQDYTPVNIFYSGQVFNGDIGLLNAGSAFNGRRPMLQLKFGGFKIAAINVHAESDLGTGGDVDTLLPKFEAKYTYKSDMWYADVFGGFQTYNIENIPGGGDIDVRSYIVGAGVGVFFGPLELAVTGYFGQNLGAGGYGLLNLGDTSPRANAARNDTIDNDTWAGMAALRYKVTPNARLEIGYGMNNHELDTDTPDDDDAQVYYAQLMLTLAKGVYLIPEIGMEDRKKSFAGADEEETFYAGAKWQIDF
jgi:hypothetical protein